LTLLDESMDAEPRVAGHEQVHVVGHRFQLDDRRVAFDAPLADGLLESVVDPAADDGATVSTCRPRVCSNACSRQCATRTVCGPARGPSARCFDEWHRCRFLWNEAVHQRKSGNRPTLCRLSKQLTEARGKVAWLRAGSQVAQQQTLRTYATALDHAYKVKGRGKPTFKARRKTLPSLEYTVRGFAIRDRRLRLPKGVSIPLVWSRELPSEPTSVPCLPRQSRPLVRLVRGPPRGRTSA
jgi:hypothetical protein